MPEAAPLPDLPPHEVWQQVYPAGTFATSGPFRELFPANLPDGRQILLPIRERVPGQAALASLIINQASFAVVDALAEALASQLRASSPEIVVGLPTLGLTLAAVVAQKLGHPRFVPLGTSRKFWYREELSVPLSSITTPDQSKRLYIDPRMLPLLEGRRVALIDDVISSGTSIAAALSLLSHVGLSPVVIGAAMLQTRRWAETLEVVVPKGVPICGVFSTPSLVPAPQGGWTEERYASEA